MPAVGKHDRTISRQGAQRWYQEAEMATKNLFKFMQEVRAEAQKITWPSRRETAITTAMVFVMVFLAAVFFLVADQVIRLAVTYVLGIGG
jgi:preprotein translocase subunit SecE